MLHTTQQEGIHESNVNSARFYDIPKSYLIKKCVSSVKDAINVAIQLNDKDKIIIEFICVYDRCSEDTLAFIKNAIPDAKMVCSNGSGNGDSFATCVDIANSMVDDDTMVLFLEDDYSFLSSNGIVKSVNMLKIARERTGRWCGMFLDDYPDRYNANGIRENTTVMVTPFGHIMSIDSSTCSFMTYVGAVKENYENLIKFKNYPAVLEGESVDLMWKNVSLFCPIPALTLHCQLRSHIPQYLNAEELKRIMEY
jgi:hypothetical protein